MRQNVNDITLLSAPGFLAQKEYWIDKLKGDITGIDLSFDSREKTGSSQEMEQVRRNIPNQLTSRLLKLSKNSDITLYIILLSGIKALVHLYTAVEDIIISSPVYKPNVTGDTINRRIFIRDRVNNGMTFKELLLSVRESTVKAYENQDYPSGKILEYLYNTKEIQDIENIASGNILCYMENIHEAGPEVIEEIRNKLAFSFSRNEDQIDIRIFYAPESYNLPFIEQIARHFVTILEQAAEDITVELSGIPLLSPQEQKRLLEDFNGEETGLPHYKTIAGWFGETVETWADNIAVVCDENHSRPCRYTYAQIDRQAGNLAAQLKARGLQTGDIVPLMVNPSQEMILGLLALIKAGGCFLPMDPESPEDRVRFMIKDTNAALMLTGPNITANNGLDIGTMAIAEILESEDCDDRGIGEDKVAASGHLSGSSDPVYAIYTSGTTGKPKGVLLKNSNLVNYVEWITKRINLTHEDKTMLTSSFAFDLGYTSLFSALLTGCRLHIPEKETYMSPGKFLRYIKHNQITYLKVTPSLFATVVTDPQFCKENLEQLRLVILGGEAIDLTDVETAHNRCSHIEFMNHYGPTEATIGCIARYIDFNRFQEYKKYPTIGKPINNATASIVDKHLNLLPPGASGELCLAGRCLGMGYLNQPRLTAQKFIESPHLPGKRLYRTGDLARWRFDGNIEFLGRFDDQVKIRGYRIELGEIENRLTNHEEIKDALVLVKERNEKDRYICAYIVFKAEKKEKELPLTKLKEYLAKELPEYMSPNYFVTLERIPLTPNGKINKRALPEPQFSRESKTYIEPQNETQQKLVAIWADVLAVDKTQIGIEDNFFELGGHSLKVTGLIVRIHKELNIEIPITQIFNQPTVREISLYIKTAEQSLFTAMELAEEKEYYPLSSAQRRLYVLHQMKFGSTHYNIPEIMRLEGDVDTGIFKNALKELIRRHDSLRTSFHAIGGTPVQLIIKQVPFQIEFFESPEEDAGNIVDNFIRAFELDTPPLLRVGLVKVEAKKHILMFDMHHIISDGSSMSLFVKEFTALCAGETLPPLKLRYIDYSQWQKRAAGKETEGLKRQKEYWLKEFADE
ncbi:MAG: amino acid adenylation domain-containing protein, partial [bacterium]|nr:amino acid adenylation domain-containing protein [bacterium]